MEVVKSEKVKVLIFEYESGGACQAPIGLVVDDKIVALSSEAKLIDLKELEKCSASVQEFVKKLVPV